MNPFAYTPPLTRISIHKIVRRDRVLEVSDCLSLETKRSQILFSILEIDEHQKAAVIVKHYADVSAIKLGCWDILNRGFDEWTEYGGRADIETPQATTLALRRDSKYRQPFVIKLDNGKGILLPDGTIKMLEVRESLTILLQDAESRVLAQTLLDYIRDWETVNFRRRQEAQTVILPQPGEMGEESQER